MRRAFHALCLILSLALCACATQQAATSSKPAPARPPAATSVTGAAVAKAPPANTAAKSAKAVRAEKAAAAKAAAEERAAAAKAAAAERAAAARAAKAAKAEAARAAAAERAAAAKAAAVARAEAAARAKAESARAAAAARAETVARAEAKARADAAARAEAAARADAQKAAAAARAEAAARAAAEARAVAAAPADAAAKTPTAEPAAPAPAVGPVAAASAASSEATTTAAALEPTAATAEPAADDMRSDYAVGGGDVLRISVYQSPDLSLDARVSESGTISYPLLGQVSVGGLSISQVEAAIANGLRNGNFLKQPQVAVLLTEVRSNQVSVLGMANRPGRYPIEVNGMLLSELLALAGGVAPGGSEIVTLSGIRNGKQYRQRVDINALFTNGAQNGNPMVRNGDTLYIDRLPNVYIYGEVQRPGPIPLSPDMTLMQAVASGGGLTQRGTERGMRVHRRDPSGEVQVLKPSMDDVLQPGDVVYVRESLF